MVSQGSLPTDRQPEKPVTLDGSVLILGSFAFCLEMVDFKHEIWELKDEFGRTGFHESS